VSVSTVELWKVAQARPGTTLRFKQVDWDASRAATKATVSAWDAVRIADVAGLELLAADGWTPGWASAAEAVDLPAVEAMLDPAAGDKAETKVTYRISGDEHVLTEYAEIELDLAYRMRVHVLMEELRPRPCVRELCPGVRSVLVKYDRDQIAARDIIKVFQGLELGVLGSVEDVVVPSRVIRLPLAFDDKWTREAQQRYLCSVRPDAPYVPSNVEFVPRINGLATVDDVKRIMSEAEYCVVGLGDVYLGAPCAVPVDPRHRLVTSKYNPARTYTPEGAVGIGGAYMCIYGMDSPGGYQPVARTIPIWDSHGQISEENRGAPSHVPWLLRFFDRVCFYPVTDDELEVFRDRYRRGDLKLDITDATFSFKEDLEFCEANKTALQSSRPSKRRHLRRNGRGGIQAARKEQRGGGARVATERGRCKRCWCWGGSVGQRRRAAVVFAPCVCWRRCQCLGIGGQGQDVVERGQAGRSGARPGGCHPGEHEGGDFRGGAGGRRRSPAAGREGRQCRRG
jgi:urea carboxylase